jgi:hypothetical protein
MSSKEVRQSQKLAILLFSGGLAYFTALSMYVLGKIPLFVNLNPKYELSL